MQEEQYGIMEVQCNETRHAFRVNGVAIAKRHLARVIGGANHIADQKVLARYLVIVPFLATAFQLSQESNESVRYGAVKAKRVYEALGLDEESTVPFMMAFLQLAEVGDSPREAVENLSGEMRAAGFYDHFQPGQCQSPAKRTLH